MFQTSIEAAVLKLLVRHRVLNWCAEVLSALKRLWGKELPLLGEYTPTFQPHISTSAAIQHSCSLLSIEVEAVWVSTETISDSLFEVYSGIWVAPGSPYKNMDKTLWAIRYAREHGIPCLGTCGGFQHIIIEYARNVLGFKDAQHAEYNPCASDLFISKLDCSLAGREMTLNLVA